jgi:hypothetical protein
MPCHCLVYMQSCCLVPLTEVRFSFSCSIVQVFVYENECCGLRLRGAESCDESCEIQKGISYVRKMICNVCEPVCMFEMFHLIVLSSCIYC